MGVRSERGSADFVQHGSDCQRDETYRATNVGERIFGKVNRVDKRNVFQHMVAEYPRNEAWLTAPQRTQEKGCCTSEWGLKKNKGSLRVLISSITYWGLCWGSCLWNPPQQSFSSPSRCQRDLWLASPHCGLPGACQVKTSSASCTETPPMKLYKGPYGLY